MRKGWASMNQRPSKAGSVGVSCAAAAKTSPSRATSARKAGEAAIAASSGAKWRSMPPCSAL